MYLNFTFCFDADYMLSYQNSYITILMIFNINKSKLTNLFMSIRVLFVFVASKL